MPPESWPKFSGVPKRYRVRLQEVTQAGLDSAPETHFDSGHLGIPGAAHDRAGHCLRVPRLRVVDDEQTFQMTSCSLTSTSA